MSKIRNQTKLETDWAELQRQPVPNCSALKNRIILQASGLPQLQKLPKQPFYRVQLIHFLRTVLQSKFRPLAVACTVAIIGLVLLNTQEFSGLSLQQNGDSLVLDSINFDSTNKSTETMDQVSWDELMLIQDELAFSDFL